MANLFKQFQTLFGGGPLQVGVVLSFDAGVAEVELLGGAIVHARGTAQPDQRVFFRDGLIEGEAPDLPLIQIDI